MYNLEHEHGKPALCAGVGILVHFMVNPHALHNAGPSTRAFVDPSLAAYDRNHGSREHTTFGLVDSRTTPPAAVQCNAPPTTVLRSTSLVCLGGMAMCAECCRHFYTRNTENVPTRLQIGVCVYDEHGCANDSAMSSGTS